MKTHALRIAAQALLVLLVLGAGAAGTWWIVTNKPAPAGAERVVPPPQVRVVEARVEDHQLLVHSQGRVAPRTEIPLVPEVSGRVVQVAPSLTTGGFFAEGDVLARIDPRDFELAVTRARAEVARATMDLEVERAEARAALAEWERLGLGREPSPLVLREPQVKRAEAALAAAEAARDQAELALERTELRAPFAGRVRSEQVDVGQFVSAGAAIAELYATDYAEVRLPLPDEELAFLDLRLRAGGDPAEVGPKVDLRARFAGAEFDWHGYVSRVEGQIDPRTGMVHVVARVDDPYSRGDDQERPPLAAGMFVHATIHGRALRDVVMLPRAALRDREGAGEAERVLVVDDEDRLHYREVVVARREGERVVLRGGLAAGDRVCVSPLGVVVEGMRVRVDDPVAAAQPARNAEER